MLNNLVGIFALILCFQGLFYGSTAGESSLEDKETTVDVITSYHQHGEHDRNNIGNVTDHDTSKASTTPSIFLSTDNSQLKSTKQPFAASSNNIGNVTDHGTSMASTTQSVFPSTENSQLNSTKQSLVESTSRSMPEIYSVTKNLDDSENVSTLKTNDKVGSSATAGIDTSVLPDISTSSMIFLNESTSDFNRGNKTDTDIEVDTGTTEMSADKSITKLVQWQTTQGIARTTMSSSKGDVTMGTNDATYKTIDATDTTTDATVTTIDATGTTTYDAGSTTDATGTTTDATGTTTDATGTTINATGTTTDATGTTPDATGTTTGATGTTTGATGTTIDATGTTIDATGTGLSRTENSLTSFRSTTGKMLVSTKSEGGIDMKISSIPISSSKINLYSTTEQDLRQTRATANIEVFSKVAEESEYSKTELSNIKVDHKMFKETDKSTHSLPGNLSSEMRVTNVQSDNQVRMTGDVSTPRQVTPDDNLVTMTASLGQKSFKHNNSLSAHMTKYMTPSAKKSTTEMSSKSEISNHTAREVTPVVTFSESGVSVTELPFTTYKSVNGQELLDSNKSFPTDTSSKNTAVFTPKTSSSVDTSHAIPELKSDFVPTTEGYTMYRTKADGSSAENSTKNTTFSSDMSTGNAIPPEDEMWMTTDIHNNIETNTTVHDKHNIQLPRVVTPEYATPKEITTTENDMLYTAALSIDNETTKSRETVSRLMTTYDEPITEGEVSSKMYHTTYSVTTPPSDMSYQTSTPRVINDYTAKSQNTTENGTIVDTMSSDMSYQTSTPSVVNDYTAKSHDTTENGTTVDYMSSDMSYQTITPSVINDYTAKSHDTTENGTTVDYMSSDNSRIPVGVTENNIATQKETTPMTYGMSTESRVTTDGKINTHQATKNEPKREHDISSQSSVTIDGTNRSHHETNGDATVYNMTDHSSFTPSSKAEYHYTTQNETIVHGVSSQSNYSLHDTTKSIIYQKETTGDGMSSKRSTPPTGTAESNHTTYIETTSVNNMSDSLSSKMSTGTAESNHTTYIETTSVNNMSDSLSSKMSTGTAESNHTTYIETTTVNNMSDSLSSKMSTTSESYYTTYIETTSVNNMSDSLSSKMSTGTAESNHTTYIETTTVNNMSDSLSSKMSTGTAESYYTTYIETTTVNDISNSNSSKMSTSGLKQNSTTVFGHTNQYLLDTTHSIFDIQTTTESQPAGAIFSVIPIEVKKSSVKLLVVTKLPEGKKCKLIEVKRKTSESVKKEEKGCSGNRFNKTFTIKELETAGDCYQLEIFVTTKMDDEIGPYMYNACTKPTRPNSRSQIQNRTTNSLTMQIVHPLNGHFDSFEIYYKMNQDHHRIVTNRSLEKMTMVELSPLVPGSCYDIDVFTISNRQKSLKPRKISKQCLFPSTPGQNHTVVSDQSSFTLSWLIPDGNVDGYHIDVFCHPFTMIRTYNNTMRSVQVSSVTPGDCCRVNVTTHSNQLYSIPQLYYVHVNESVPEAVTPDIVSKHTELIIVWSPPLKSNGWLLGYNIQLYDNTRREINTYSIECVQSEINCHERFDQKRFQCLQYDLMGNTNGVKFRDSGTSLKLTISKLHPGISYYYNISAYNKIGSNSTSLIQVKTLEDKPSAPANLNVIVLNTTSINITWLPPETQNGVITKYNVTYKTDVSTKSFIEVDGDVNTVLLTDLDCWNEYYICVSAKTSEGYGRPICDSGETDVYEPLSQIKHVRGSSSQIELDFEIPCEGLSISIIYNISYVSLNHTCTKEGLNNVTNYQQCYYGDPCQITGLHSYWDYHIQVQETVKNKVGPWSKSYTAKTNPDSPGEVRRLNVTNITSNSLTVCWDKPCFINGPLYGYEVIAAEKTDKVTGTCSIITSLSPYTEYNLSVVTVSDKRRSQPSYIRGKTDVAKPAKPTNVSLTIAATKIRVAWSTIYPYPGPTNYTVNLKENEDGIATHSCKTPSFNDTDCIVNGLEEFWRYNVTVTAHTSRGSNTSLVRFALTREAAPGQVTNLSVEPETNPENPRQIYVRFNAPKLRDRNGRVKAYYIRCMSAQSKKIINELKLDSPSEVKIVMPDQHLLNISVFAETIANGTEVFKTVIVPEGDKGFPILLAVAGISSAILVLAIMGVMAIFYKKKMFFFRPKPKEKEVIHMKAVKHPKKKISVETEDKRKNRPVKFDRFYQHVEILARDSNHFFSKEYKELKTMAPVFSTEAAEQQEARTKNRYSNILPFDHSRVKLLPLDDEEGSDYINANYIPGFNSKREYIATQGPLPSTKDDFWRMIWEQNVSVIVMLTQCVERGKRKCECYWPECVKEPVYHGDISIEIENESHLPEYVLRTINITLGAKRRKVKHVHYLKWPDFGCPDTTWLLIDFVRSVQVYTPHVNPGPIVVHCRITMPNDKRNFEEKILSTSNRLDFEGDIQKRVTHFLYLAWPDMGVPSSTDNMISFVKTVRSHVHPTMKGPIIVHCSAGVGRTGTFIAVDVLLHQLDNDNNQIDIFGDVLQLRNHRCNMVQTEDQYVFIHHCISDYILALSEDSDEEEAIDGGDEPMYQNFPPR